MAAVELLPEVLVERVSLAMTMLVNLLVLLFQMVGSYKMAVMVVMAETVEYKMQVAHLKTADNQVCLEEDRAEVAAEEVERRVELVLAETAGPELPAK